MSWTEFQLILTKRNVNFSSVFYFQLFNSSLKSKYSKLFNSSQIKSPGNSIENSNPEVVAGQNSILVVRKTRCKLSCNNIFSLQFWPKFILNLRVNWMEWMALESGWMLVVLLCWFYTIPWLIMSLELSNFKILFRITLLQLFGTNNSSP